jgi:hypothetical protein
VDKNRTPRLVLHLHCGAREGGATSLERRATGRIPGGRISATAGFRVGSGREAKKRLVTRDCAQKEALAHALARGREK